MKSDATRAPYLLPTLPAHPPTVDYKNMTMNVVARSRGKKYGCTADIRRLAPTLRRNSLENLAITRLLALQRRGIIRTHVTRRNSIHVYSLRSPLVGQCFRQLRHRSF